MNKVSPGCANTVNEVKTQPCVPVSLWAPQRERVVAGTGHKFRIFLSPYQLQIIKVWSLSVPVMGPSSPICRRVPSLPRIPTAWRISRKLHRQSQHGCLAWSLRRWYLKISNRMRGRRGSDRFTRYVSISLFHHVVGCLFGALRACFSHS